MFIIVYLYTHAYLTTTYASTFLINNCCNIDRNLPPRIV
jgi:hypothetical protein